VTATAQQRAIPWPFLRSPDERLITGVAGGIGARLGVRPVYVRAAFVATSLALGTGLFVYVIASLVVPAAESHITPATTTAQQKIGIAALFLAVLFLLQSVGMWLGAVTWPLIVALFGLAVAIDTTDFNYERSLEGVMGTKRRPWWLVVAGLAMMVLGFAIVLTYLDALQRAGALVAAVLLTAAGFLIVGGPWMWSIIEDLRTERTARIRSEERAEMAAHLHDSVLQSLALIQRTDDPKKMVTLARAQERDLRAWLYDPEAGDVDTLRGALTAAATHVEQAHDTPVFVVVAGDARLSPSRQKALVGAATEAMMNAAEHSGAAKVSVFAEAVPSGVDVFVTDQGVGFDQEAVEDDRKGIAESIRARMVRNGGTVTIESALGSGTDVHLHMPQEPA